MKPKYLCLPLGIMLCIGAFFVSTPVRGGRHEGRYVGAYDGSQDGGYARAPVMPFTTTKCMTKKDLVPQSSEKKDNCKILEQKATGNKVVWKARCTEKDSVIESEGEITYSGTTYSGSQKTKITEKADR